jgi:large subunit ribosomal protein L6
MIESLDLPEGITCTIEEGVVTLQKGGKTLNRNVSIPGTTVNASGNKVVFEALQGNKNTRKRILSNIAHVKNLIKGLEKEFIYKLEACNVHFPMTLKVEGDRVVINNFLGGKTPRVARILPSVQVKITGQTITVTSANREFAGQTAANLERATKVVNRDRRIFQDGIFITEKPGRDE